MTTALFIGRFQPFHKGHLSAIQEIAKENDKIIIGIGSPNRSNTKENPFTYGERRNMIELALSNYPEINYEIIPIEDVGDDLLWAKQIQNRIKFDLAYTSENEWTKSCFENAGIRVKLTTFIEPYKAREIREKISRGEEWKDLVPELVYKYIAEINGVERVKNIYTTSN